MGSTIIAVVLSAIIAIAWSYPTTVPPSPEVCSKMTPGHGPSPQKSQAPYTIELSSTNVKGGNNVQVTLSGSDGATFKGFYIQARDTQGNRVGTFLPDDDQVKAHGCGGIKNNAAHHSGKKDKESVTVHWKAPQAYSGQVTFVATFVQEFETFWTNVKSDAVTVSKFIYPTTRNFTDSREERTSTKAAQESRILNYNPYTPYSPYADSADFSSAFPPDVIPTTYSDSDVFHPSITLSPEKSSKANQPPRTRTKKLSSSSSSRIRKSYYIPLPSNPHYDPVPDTVVINEENCKSFGHYHTHRPTGAHSPAIPTPVIYHRTPIQNYRFQTSSVAFPTPPAQGAGFNRLDPVLRNPSYATIPRPSQAIGNSFPSRYPLPNIGAYPPQIHHHYPQHQNQIQQTIPSLPTPVGFYNHQGSKSNSNSAAYFTGNSHGVLVNDPDVINTGIVIPKNMRSFEVPRYGYLIFNPKRGPPFYIIPADTTAFESYFGRSARSAK